MKTKQERLIEAKLKTTMNDWDSYEFVEMSQSRFYLYIFHGYRRS